MPVDAALRPAPTCSDRVIKDHVDFFGAAQADGDGFDLFDDLLFFCQRRVDGQAFVTSVKYHFTVYIYPAMIQTNTVGLQADSCRM